MAPIARSFAEPLMIDLTSVPATQNPSSPRMVCTTTMAVVTATTDGGLLSPLRECAMGSANSQSGTIHKRMRNTPTQDATGTGQPVSCPRWTIHPACRFPTPLTGLGARALALHGGGATLSPGEYEQPVAALPQRRGPGPGQRALCGDIHGRRANQLHAKAGSKRRSGGLCRQESPFR